MGASHSVVDFMLRFPFLMAAPLNVHQIRSHSYLHYTVQQTFVASLFTARLNNVRVNALDKRQCYDCVLLTLCLLPADLTDTLWLSVH